MSCRECVFRSEYRDMGASADVCTLHINLASAINACDHSEDCKYRFTHEEAKAIAFERAGGKPTETHPAAERRWSSDDPVLDFKNTMSELVETLRQSWQKLADDIKPLAESIKVFAEKEGTNDEKNL